MKKLLYFVAPAALILASCAEGGSGQSFSAAPRNTAPTLVGDAAISYQETGTAAVATYTATDAEGNGIVYSWSGTDAAQFTLSNAGVLASSPHRISRPRPIRTAIMCTTLRLRRATHLLTQLRWRLLLRLPTKWATLSHKSQQM